MMQKTFSIITTFEFSVRTLMSNVRLFFLLMVLIGVPALIDIYITNSLRNVPVRSPSEVVEQETCSEEPGLSSLQCRITNLMRQLYLDRSVGFTLKKTVPTDSSAQESKISFKWIFFDYKHKRETDEYSFWISIFGIMMFLINVLLNLIAYRLVMNYLDQHVANFNEALSVALQRWLPGIIAMCLYILLFGFGFVLLVVPAILVLVRYYFIEIALVDGDHYQGIGHAFRLSAACTQGVRWQFFAYVIIRTLLGLCAQVILWGIGIFITGPLLIVADVYLYRTLLAQTSTVGKATHS
jgi:hypothetical protein